MNNDYEQMLEDLHLGEVYRESKEEPKRSFDELVDEMRQSGEIDV